MSEVSVIGGGLAGCATAYYLARDGVEVTLLEQGELNSLASGSNAGSLHVQIPAEPFRLNGSEWAGAFAETLPMFLASIEMWQSLSAELDTDLEVKLRGGLMLAESPEEMAIIERKAAVERAAGVTIELLGRAELRERAPYLSEHIVGAAFCPTEGKANPLLVAPAFAAAATRHGARIRQRTSVRAINRDRAGYVLETNEGRLQARQVINAAGAAAGSIARGVGVELAMRAEAIQVSVTEPIAPLIPHLVYAVGQKLTLKQGSNGSLLIGGGWPARIDSKNRPVADPDSLSANLRVALSVVPQIGGVRLLRTWAAFVNGTDSWRPLLGELPGLPGFWLCYVPWLGFSGGPAAARIVASLVQGREPPFDFDSRVFAPGFSA